MLRLASQGPEPQGFRVGALRFLLAHRPAEILEVLEQDRQGWPKAGLGRAEAVIGQGLLTSRAAHHDRQRRLAEAAFAPQQVAGLQGLWVAATERLLDRWATLRGDREVFGELCLLSASCISEALFGALNDEDRTGIASDLACCLAWLNRYPEPLALLDGLPSPARRRMRAARARLRARATEAWRSGAGGPLLGPLRAARDADGRGMEEEAAVDELLTFLIAAFEPTAVALSWTLWRLALHPHWQEKLAAEVPLEAGSIAVAEGAITAVQASAEPAVDGGPYPLRRAFLRECLRLHPPIWVVARRAPRAFVLADRPVVAGTWLMLSPLVTQRGPAYQDSLRFDPERWLEAEPPAGAYLPFGFGLRRCLGEGLATGLVVSFLGGALRRLHLSLPDAVVAAGGRTPTMEATITLRPKGGLRLKVEARA